jgi:predicted lipid-binding transport protein (Tim44 family)
LKIPLILSAAVLALTLVAGDADAAKRFGGGSSLGKQRPAPTMKEAPKQAPAAAPAQPAQAAPAATPPTPAAKPSFMSRFGGLIAGLGLGVLLGSLFSGGLGSMGGILAMLLLGGLAFMAWRAYASRRTAAASTSAPMEFAAAGAGAAPGTGSVAPTRPALNIGAGVSGAATPKAETASTPAPESAVTPIPGFEAEPFLRVAKTSFIRLQAANDAKDLNDIRDFTTPEMFAEISMQIRERGDAPQKTEVVSVNASLVEAVIEGDYAVVSVRFTGLIREEKDANPEPFDEIWHVRQDQRDRKATWLIAGIQQVS